MTRLNYEKLNGQCRSMNSVLESRKSERQPMVKRPPKKNHKTAKPKKISVSYTLRNGVMPYGKFKNWKISDLPTDYIIWAILNLNEGAHDVVKSVLESLAIEMSRRDPSL